ncbi:hypothetical protein BDW22DRAFT_1405206 [Trametopsis cervina]|nr:hypothetical protein BDW22DRAFT_1405206 [Trametopsis cervina]
MSSVPAERSDIHKSCKAIEVVVNLLNDYCDAATTIVTIQKKLSKAMREASSVRGTSEIVVNALNACALVVEALVEVDSKFTKLADKECESLSGDVKKWFKTLAKEERVHDAKLASTDAKIKQAGQNYEKKVKKNPANAADEHARYINLLGALGHEISQKKNQHALSVYQQHTTLALSMAVSVCRITDAEWFRACEQVRGVALGIGRVGEWRSLCEGGWLGQIPGDLPDIDSRRQPELTGRTLNVKMSMNNVKPALSDDGLVTPQTATPAPEYASRANSPADYSPSNPPTYFSPKNTPADVSQSISEAEDIRDRSQSINSIASLGSFPVPPTHFPIPPVQSSTPVTPTERYQSPQQAQSQAPTTPTLSESPEPSTPEASTAKLRSESNNTTFLDLTSPQTSPKYHAMNQTDGARLPQPLQATTQFQESQESHASSSSTQPPKVPSSSSSSGPSSSSSSAFRTSQAYKRGDYIDNSEFGVRKSGGPDGISEEQRSSSPGDRRDGNRSSSSLSILRDKYARSVSRSLQLSLRLRSNCRTLRKTAPASPPPRDIPRLPLSVSNLATRYESVAESQDPRREPKSPTEERRLSMDTRAQGRSSPVAQRTVMSSPQTPSSYASAMSGPSDDDIARRRQRIRELEEMELREQEHELRLQQREIEHRSRELEKDRQRLINSRTYRTESPPVNHSVHRLANPSATNLSDSSSSSPVPSRPPFTSSSTQPAPPMGQRFPSQQSTSSQPSSPSLYHPNDHPDTCGCEVCSVTKYNRPSVSPMASSQNLRTPEGPNTTSNTYRSEKPKGWIRRLSMPVMANAFSSSDSKKGISSANYISNSPTGYRNSLVTPDEDGRLRPPMGEPYKNRSSTNLARR